jgi:outer membrane protein assembly factor BamD (BamD/ComL family)
MTPFLRTKSEIAIICFDRAPEANKCNKVKWCWFWAASACFILSAVSVHGQAAAQLQKAANDAMSRNDYATAAKDYNTIVTTYPSTPNIEIITISAGYAFLHSDDYLKAIDVLSKLTPESVKPEFRGKALFFTGLAQFSQAHKLSDQKQDAPSKEEYREAEQTLTTLIDFIIKDKSPDNLELLENAMYYQALCAYGQNKYPESEADLDGLLAKFPTSLQKPDYLLLLGSIYAVQANDLINAKKTDAEVVAASEKAIATFDQVVADPNAKVQGNEANMREGEILYLIAQVDPTNYTKAIEVFRRVLRKEDMIEVQQGRIDQLRAQQQIDLQNGGVNASTVANNKALVLDREVARLKELTSGPDPIIQALIRMAECYIGLKDADSARTILRRLRGLQLPPDQQQEVDLQILTSYTLGGVTDKADAALNDYLAKHAGDPSVDSISVQIAAALGKRKDYAGELKQALRSLHDFPNGKHVAEAIELQADALTNLGRVDEASKVIDNFLKANPTSPVAFGLLISQGKGFMQKNDLKDALHSFDQVRNNTAAGPFQASAGAYYIQVLNTLQRYDDVIKEGKDFQAKFPKENALASVEVITAVAMDKKNDPAAIPMLQSIAKQFSDNQPIASYALYYVVAIYQREQKTAEMIQAVTDLRTAFPTAYAFISQANDTVVAILEKQKKFDDAAALYQPLTTAPQKDVAAEAQNKIGGVWLDAAKAMGNYQSLQTDLARAEAEKRMSSAEQAYVATLKNFPDQLDAVGDALQGLVNTATARDKWGLLKDGDLEGYLAKMGADLTTPEMQTRLELAKAGLVFVIKNGHAQDAAALDRMTKAIAASPNLQLTTQEADQYGALLIGAKKYPEAQVVYQALLANAKSNESVKLAAGYYGMAATYLAQNDYPNAKIYFAKMLNLPNGAAWSAHATDAQLGMAEINEQSSSPDDIAAAKNAYADIMRSPVAGAPNQANAMLGYGRLLEKAGAAVKTPTQADIEYATHYYEQVDLFYGPALPELSAQGLYLAGQAYLKAGDAADAKKDFDKLRATYPTTAPDWVQKAPAQ